VLSGNKPPSPAKWELSHANHFTEMMETVPILKDDGL